MGKSNPIKWSYDMVKEYIEKEGYILISKEYVRKRDKLKMICPYGHEIELSFDCFHKGVRCGECHRCNPRIDRRQTIEEIRKVIEDVEGYTLLSKEYDPRKKIKIRHSCGNEYEVRLNGFKRGNRCPKCRLKETSEKMRIKKERVVNHIQAEGYKIISMDGFQKSQDKLKLECPRGHVWDVSWNNFRNGKRCSKCNDSKGEVKIKKYLESNKIEYVQQYRFEDCRNAKPLPFDFYLPSQNICIEYDGKQHYELVNFSGKMTEIKMTKRLEDCRENDNIKTQYCRNNNIKLIRIPYWEFENIESILIEEI